MGEQETVTSPVLDVQMGEPYTCALVAGQAGSQVQRARFCVVWVDGRRFEGTLYEQPKDKGTADSYPDRSSRV